MPARSPFVMLRSRALRVLHLKGPCSRRHDRQNRRCIDLPILQTSFVGSQAILGEPRRNWRSATSLRLSSISSHSWIVPAEDIIGSILCSLYPYRRIQGGGRFGKVSTSLYLYTLLTGTDSYRSDGSTSYKPSRGLRGFNGLTSAESV